MDYVYAHVSRACNADQSIHIRAVHVNEPTRGVNDLTNLLYVSLEQPERVRVCKHEPRHLSVGAELPQVIQIRETFRGRLDGLD